MPAAEPEHREHDVLPLAPGDGGEAVRDLQLRLGGCGHDVGAGELGRFGDRTEAAVRTFQQQRGLRPSGSCDAPTWAALVEAGFHLGDRLLYLRRPMLRGEDVADLQLRLGGLGFDAGRPDGIFGRDTERAVRAFERNAGLTTDGVCGPEVLQALQRLGERGTSVGSVASVRERLRLEAAPRQLTDRRVVVGESGGLDVLANAVGRALHDAGARVAVLHHPDPSHQAGQANSFEAEMYVGFSVGDPPCHVAYFGSATYVSPGGQRLAEHTITQLATCGFEGATSEGMRLPLLRETRMPAVLVHLAPPSRVVHETAAIAAAVTVALSTWATEPVAP